MTTPIDDSPSQLSRIVYDHWVGRVDELEEAKTLWQRAASGQGQVLLISGEPGVGKTRFVRELISEAHFPGASLLTGECYTEGGAPYGPLAQIIRETIENAYQNGVNLPGEILRDLLPIIPSLHSPLIDNIPVQKYDPSVEQQRVYEGFVAFCATLCSQGPVLLFIDDAHWADTGTLFLLRNLARRGRKLPLMVVMTYRDSELESAPDLNGVLIDLNRERLAFHIKLERLSRDETHDLLAGMFAEQITPDFLDGIYRQTEGNPFFIEEVCKTLVEGRQLSYQDGQWHRLAMAEMKIPQTVHAAIRARLHKLPDFTQEALQMAAILGSDFDFETLKQASDLEEEKLIEALERAERAQLIAEAQTVQGAGIRYNFVHVLIPTAMREGIIHIRRRRLHLRAAQAIEAVHPEDYEVLAYQYSEGGEVDRARQYYVQAGDRAKWSAPGESARFYQAALERWEGSGDQAGRAALLAQLGYCKWVIDDIPGSLSCYETAYELFDQLGNCTQSGEMQRMMGRLYWEQANLALAKEHYFKALDVLEQDQETPELARAISSISQMYMLAPDDEQGIVWGQRALAMAERLGVEDVVVHALNNIGTSYVQSGDFEKGLANLRESLDRSLAAGLPEDACRAYYNLADLFQRQCQYARSRDMYLKQYAYASKVYAQNYVNTGLFCLMWVDWINGKWSSALAYRARMVEFSGDLYTTWAKRIFGMIDLDLGRIEEGSRILEESLPDALRAMDLQTTLPHLGQLTRAYSVTGHESKATEMIHQIIEIVSEKDHIIQYSIMPLLMACQYSSQMKYPNSHMDAQALLVQLEQHAQRYPIGEAAAALAEGNGYLAKELRPGVAAEYFRQAAVEWQNIERPYDQARALSYLGHALKTLRDPTASLAAFHQALEIIDSLSNQLDLDYRSSFLASPMVREIQDAVEALSLETSRRNPRRKADQLTGREIEVLKLVAQGLTNAQIAELLTLSPLTVNAHLRSIFNKLDVTTRTAAVRHGMELGLF